MIWVCGAISNHISPGHAHCPTVSHTHTFLIRSYQQSVPTELLICRSNCSHFLDSSIIGLNRFLGRRMSNCARASQNRQKSFQKIRTYANDFIFLLRITVLPTVHSSMCCSLFMCVVLTYPLFLQSATPSEILSTRDNNKRKQNMWGWLWVGQWVWPVEK